MHKKMTIYLDADPAPVLASDTGKDLKHLAFKDQKGVYKFEVLNLDRQKSKTLSISISRPLTARAKRRRKARLQRIRRSIMSRLKGKRTKF